MVGLTGPLCVETEAPFMGATELEPVENKCRPYGKKKSKSTLVQENNQSLFLLRWEQGMLGEVGGKAWGAVCLEGGFLGEGQGGCGRLQALQPGLGAQGEGLSRAILHVSHPAVTAAAPTSPSSSSCLPLQPEHSGHEEHAASCPGFLGGVLPCKGPGQAGAEPERAHGPTNPLGLTHPAAATAAQPAWDPQW